MSGPWRVLGPCNRTNCRPRDGFGWLLLGARRGQTRHFWHQGCHLVVPKCCVYASGYSDSSRASMDVNSIAGCQYVTQRRRPDSYRITPAVEHRKPSSEMPSIVFIIDCEWNRVCNLGSLSGLNEQTKVDIVMLVLSSAGPITWPTLALKWHKDLIYVRRPQTTCLKSAWHSCRNHSGRVDALIGILTMCKE